MSDKATTMLPSAEDRARLSGQQGSIPDLVAAAYRDALVAVCNDHDALVAERDLLRQALVEAQETLKNIEGGYHVPDSMLSSKEVFRAEFAPFLQKQAREALARIREALR